ncbi:MAG TPA: SDR family oxidoreductase [Solirubrobacteraceae bacterium]|nr:SDR family oxidoreductase [Solirubrobacteraceae bacterium]
MSTVSSRTLQSDGATLLTGATGFVGMAVLARLLERTDRQIVALVRAGSQDEADARLCAVMRSLFDDPEQYEQRIEAVRGDLTAPWLGLDAAARERIAVDVDEIIHGAASVAFDLPLPESRAINVEGTRRVLALATACAARGDGLRRLTYVSTAYVAGDRRGVALEPELDMGQGFRNAYEQSKHEAEQLVHARRVRFPVTVVRPSIVVGERQTGWTASFNVIYTPLRAFAAGTYPVVPGRRGAVVDVVTVDHVADAILALTAAPDAAGRTFHVVGGDHSTTLGELSLLASRSFDRRQPRFLPPWIYRTLIHPLLLRRGNPGVRRRLRRTEVYFPYFSLDLRFDDRCARELLDPLGIRATPIRGYFDAMVDFAEAAEWGRNPIGLAQARARCAGVTTESLVV